MSKCPPHCPGYDFELNLVENAKLPPPAKPYHLSQAEGQILKEWIQGMFGNWNDHPVYYKMPHHSTSVLCGKEGWSKEAGH